MTNKEKERAKARRAKERAKARRAKALLKKQNSPTYLKKKADNLFHALVRATGSCQSGRDTHKGPLQCAHGFSRRYLASRWDVRNAWCFCAGCHLFYTHRPLEWDEWMRVKMGTTYWLVRYAALHGEEPDKSKTVEQLKARLNDYSV